MPGPGSYLIGDEEKQQLLDVIDSGYLFRYGQEDDPRFKRKAITFEEEFSQYIGVNHCVAVSSGTGALMTALAAIGIEAGDEVIVPGYTFIASISSIIIMGAVPVLAEIDESLTLDPEDVRKKITAKTKAIMPVHMLGNPCDMERIAAIAKEFNLYIIEDCCQAAGASYRGRKVGSIGHVGAFSLNFFKTISAGDGGMVVMNDAELYEKAFGFHDQGHKPLRMGAEIGNRNMVGINLRINELTAAVALAQLRKIEFILSTLREKKHKLKEAIAHHTNVKFRVINDPGECSTLLTLLFPHASIAAAFAETIGATTLSHSGWHVYNNMEQIIGKYPKIKYNWDKEISAHSLPATDRILARAVNISVGVVDSGLGAPYGISILSDDAEIAEIANSILQKLEFVSARGVVDV